MGSVFGTITVETPKYTEVAAKTGYAIRQYAPQIRAEVTYETAPGGAVYDSLNAPFSRLAGYIFGKNSGVTGTAPEKVAMTAPVVMQNAPSEKIAMTAPVVMKETNGEKSQRTMAFILPSKYTSLDQLPKPKDDGIRFVEVPSQQMAVITFAGRMVGDLARNKETELREACAKDNVKLSTDPNVVQYCGYNPPWCLPWFAKNEIMIPCEA